MRVAVGAMGWGGGRSKESFLFNNKGVDERTLWGMRLAKHNGVGYRRTYVHTTFIGAYIHTYIHTYVLYSKIQLIF